jgi:hypothetical protein
MKKILVTLAIVCLAGTAMAQVDPDPDGIGMYFDLDATQYCLDYTGGPVSVYLVLTNASEPTGISGWECHVTYTVPAGDFETGWVLPAGSLNVSTAPDFVVGLAAPAPWAPAILLGTYGILVFATGSMEWYVGPADTPSIPGVPVYAAGDNPGNLIPLQMVSGSPDLPVAQLNIGCPGDVIGTQQETFGSVKAMFK